MSAATTTVVIAASCTLPALPARAAVPAAQPGGFTALAPARVFDGPAGAQGRVAAVLAGRGGVPGSGVSAVVLSLTAGAPGAAGSLVAHPRDAPRPDLAQVSFAAGAGAQERVTVPFGDGVVEVDNRSAGRVRISIDVVGYYRAGGAGTPGAFAALTPAPIGQPSIAAGHAATIRVAGVGGVPTSGAAAVLVNLTGSGAAGSLVAYRHGAARPPGVTTLGIDARPSSTQAVVQVGADGSVELFNDSAGTARVAAHVVGYFRAGAAVAAGTFAGRQPADLVDTLGGARFHPLPVGQTIEARLAGGSGWPVPRGSVALLAVSVPAGPVGTALTVFPGGATPPAGPSLRFAAGRPGSALLAVPSGIGDAIQVRNDSLAAVHLRIAVVGLYTDGSLGAVTGRLDDATGSPVEGVGVGGDAVASAADGTYALSGLAAGDTSLCLTPALARGGAANGYLDQCVPATVTPGAATAVDARLQEGGAYTGTINDGSHPLANVELTLSAGDRSYSTRTDQEGSWRLSRLESGSYHFCFNAAGATGGASTGGAAPLCFGSLRVEIVAPETEEQQFTLPPAAVIAGRVTDPAGNPVRGAVVHLQPSQGTIDELPGTAVTAADGTYRTNGLGPGAYDLCVSTEHASGASSKGGYQPTCLRPSSMVTVQVAEVKEGVDAVAAPGGAIAGRVTDPAGRPLASVQVRIADALFGDVFGTVTSAADGTYRFGGLPAGRFVACFTANRTPFVPPATGLLDECRDTEVTIGQVSTLDARLGPGGSVTGHVTDPAGAPLGGVTVHVVDGQAGHDVRTAADGGYTVRWLSPGVTHLCFDGRATGHGSECYDDVPLTGVPTDIPVTAGRLTSGIDVVLESDGEPQPAR
jgi:hypothetical protein